MILSTRGGPCMYYRWPTSQILVFLSYWCLICMSPYAAFSTNRQSRIQLLISLVLVSDSMTLLLVLLAEIVVAQLVADCH